MTDPVQGGESPFLRIPRPDEPIYRIFPLWFLEEALRLRRITLVDPELWEDPYELLAQGVAILDKSVTPWQQIFLERHLRPAYAQAWSRTAESDTLLRAYSRVVKDPHFGRNTCPRDEGVRVRSTPRKLLAALTAWCPQPTGNHCYIGAVQYLPRERLLQHVANVVAARGAAAFAIGRPRAELLLMKRHEYSHEAEIRLIYIEERDLPPTKVVQVPIDPNYAFEEVSFDPRLQVFEQRERETVVRSLGYTGQISRSDLYQRTLLEIDPTPRSRASEDDTPASA